MAAVDAQPFRHETCRLAAHVICSRREPDPATQIYTARCQHKKPEPEPVWCMCRICIQYLCAYMHAHSISNALKSLRLYCKCNLHSCIVTDGGRGRRGYWVIVDYWRVTVSPTPSCLQMVWLTSQQSSSSSYQPSPSFPWALLFPWPFPWPTRRQQHRAGVALQRNQAQARAQARPRRGGHGSGLPTQGDHGSGLPMQGDHG